MRSICVVVLFFIVGWSVDSYATAYSFAPHTNSHARIHRGACISKPSINIKQGSRSSTELNAIKGPVRYSSGDWFECIKTLPTSRILYRIRSHLAANILWTTLIWLLHKHKVIGFLSNFPAIPHSVMGSALSLLLVFRTNSSYDRFWEARKLWGTIIAAVRDLARATSIHLDKRYHCRIGCLLIAFTVALKQHLQGERVDGEFRHLLPTDELPSLQKMKNRPLMLAQLISREIHAALKTSDPSHVIAATLHEHLMEEYVHALVNSFTSCERILKQPVPLSYSRHSSRFLSLYTFTLPLVLVSPLGWLVIPVNTLISWGFYCIHEIGHFIEEPFNKKLQLIPIGQLIAIMRMDVEAILGNIFSEEVKQLDNDLLEKARANARQREDDYFAYY